MIAYLLLNIFWLYILSRFFAFFFDTVTTGKYCLAASYILFYFLNSTIQIIFHHPILNMMTSLAGLLIISLNYCANTQKRLLSVTLIYILSMLCDISTAIALSGYFPGKRLGPEAASITYLLIFIVELLLEQLFNLKKTRKLNTAHWFALTGVPVSSIIIICVLIMEGFPDKRINLVIILLLLIINILIFYLYDTIQNVYLKELRQQYMERQLEAYASQMDIMVKSQEKIASLRHDLKHHMNTIMALAEGKQYKDVEAYVRNMENHLKDSVISRYSANHVIDSILNYMLSDIYSDFIHLDINVSVPEEIGIDNFDSIILGNLMSNAIRAALESAEKYLKLYMKDDRGILHIVVENSFLQPAVQKNGNFVSTKPSSPNETHGLGLINVRSVVEKDHGQAEFSQKDNIFHVTIKMYTNVSLTKPPHQPSHTPK